MDQVITSNTNNNKKSTHKTHNYLNIQLELQGFGDPAGEYWLGNEFVSQLTNQKRYVLKILLKDWEGNEAYSLYDQFYLANEEQKYR